MNEATRVDGLEDFPFGTFSELQDALASGDAHISVDQSVARDLVLAGGVGLSRGEHWFSTIFSFCWLWGGIGVAAAAWSSLGLSATLLAVVCLASFLVNRPWTSATVTYTAIGLTLWGALGGNAFLVWGGGAWLVVWFLSNGWQNWCTDRVSDRARDGEEFFVRMYVARHLAVVLKSGERIMRGLTEDELRTMAHGKVGQ